MKEKDLINQYKRQMENRSEEPPTEVWDNIANELDVDEVWGNIAEELDAEEKKRVLPWFWIRTAAAVLLIASTLSLVWWFTSQENERLATEDLPENTIQQEESNQSNENITPDQQLQNPSLALENEDESAISHQDEPFYRESEESGISPGNPTNSGTIFNETENRSLLAEEDQSNQDNSEQGTSNTEVDQQIPSHATENEIAMLNSATAMLKTNDNQPLFMDTYEKQRGDFDLQTRIGDKTASNTFALGLSTAIKNTWMLNQETIDGLDRLNHNQTDVTFYPDLGLSFKYMHNSRWSLETDLFLSSSTGQSYRQYINGQYTIRDISLRYFQSEFTAGYSFQLPSGAFNRQIIAKPVAGVYFSYLYSAREKRNDASLNVMDQYQNADYGIMAGHHFDITISNHFVFSPGLRVKWGLSDIYKGTDSPSAFSDQTLNRSFEFRLNFYYNF
jgi:hypothetical protein